MYNKLLVFQILGVHKEQIEEEEKFKLWLQQLQNDELNSLTFDEQNFVKQVTWPVLSESRSSSFMQEPIIFNYLPKIWLF